MAILLVIALIFAWPTAGISLVAYFGLVAFRAYHRARRNRLNAIVVGAMQSLQAGEGRPPSWINNDIQTSAFIGATISEATRKGVPKSFIDAHFSSAEHKAAFICLLGLIERKGCSIREQGIAATIFICEMWKVQSQHVATKMSQLRELLTDDRVHQEISALLDYGSFYAGDDELNRMLDDCIEAAEEVCKITGQKDQREVLSVAIGRTKPFYQAD